MLKTLIPLLFCAFLLSGKAQINPDFPMPRFWFSADSINEDVFLWPDLSGHNRHVNYPATFDFSKVLMNFQPCISVDTLQAPLYVDYKPVQSSEVSVFAVYKTFEDSTAAGIWNIQLDSASRISMSSQFIIDLKKVNTYDNITNESSVVNLFRYKWTKHNIDSAVSGFTFLGNDSLLFSGRFAELMYFDSTISFKDITKIHTYLAIKYGICIHGMNYMNSDDQIIWKYIDNKDYSNEIAGIGKDSSLLVDQKQSCASGGESELTISAGQLMTTNAGNTYQINELDFLIWGDNGKDFGVFVPDTMPQDSIPGVSERKWLMSVSGSTASQISTNIKMLAPDLLNDSLILILLISRDTDFNFPDTSSIFFFPDSIDSAGYFYFNGINWDIDSSGTDAFSFKAEKSMNLNNKTSEIIEDDPNNNSTSTDNGKISYVIVYPNPTTGNFRIETVLSSISEIKISVVDETGRSIMNNQYGSKNSYSLNYYLPVSGYYIISVNTTTDSKKIKLIVQ